MQVVIGNMTTYIMGVCAWWTVVGVGYRNNINNWGKLKKGPFEKGDFFKLRMDWLGLKFCMVVTLGYIN